jgi:hypothetical protein
MILPTSILAVDALTVDLAQALLTKNGGKEGKTIEASTMTITVMQNHSIREKYLALSFMIDADQR